MALKSFRVRSRLPLKYNTAIGRMVSRFSVIEGRLRNIIHSLLELRPEYGRVAVKSPRVEDAFAMIQDLMALRGFTTTVHLKGSGGLIAACKELERFRDKVAHGLWVFYGDNPLPILQVTSGSYQEGNSSQKARIVPQALGVTLVHFRLFATGASNCLKGIDRMAAQIKKQHTALLKKRRQRLAQDLLLKLPPIRRIPAKRKSRQKSSRG